MVGSSALVASSHKRTLGLVANARAMATRCFCPPDNCAGYACALSAIPTEATEMFHILKNAENPHFYGFRLHTFRTTDKVIRYGINNQFDFAEHPAVIQRGEKRTINICVAVPDVA